MNRPYISFCIPTYERVNELQETINNILNKNISSYEFEICISDDSVSNCTEIMMEGYRNHCNILYQKIEPCDAFENLTNALKMGRGYLLKLLDDHCKITEEGFETLLESAKENYNEKPQMFYLDGYQEKKIVEGLDGFFQDVGIQVTHARNFAIWREDLVHILEKENNFNVMFPHVSMICSCTYKNNYCVYRNRFFEEIELKRKGGYNLYEVFGFEFVNIVKDLYIKNQICQKTYMQMKKSVLQFLVDFNLKVRTQDKYYFSINKSIYYLRRNYSAVELLYYFHLLNRRGYYYLREKKYYCKTEALSKKEFENVTEKFVNKNNLYLRNKNIWIYGAGEGGRIVLDILSQNDIKVQGFFDVRADSMEEKYGLKVSKLSKDNIKNKYIIISLRAFDQGVYETFKKLHILKKNYKYLILEE